jgi:CheY-like chemotaxis protein
MGEVLRVNGYRVLEACDGDSALSIFGSDRDNIDLVFLDVRMPKKNGREVREEILKDRPDTRFLFMSGYAADIMDGHGAGKNGFNFISKAAMPQEILNKVREVLDGR